MPLTVAQQTLQLGFRIAFTWAGGLLLAVAVQAALPDQSGIQAGSEGDHLVSAVQSHRVLDLHLGGGDGNGDGGGAGDLGPGSR